MSVTFDDVVAVVRLIEPDAASAQKLGPDALPHLRRLLQDEDLSVARRAASVATKIKDRRALAVVGLASQSPHRELRLAAASELWRLAEFDVTKLAVRLLADPDQTVRRRAVRSLAVTVPQHRPKPALQRRIEVTAARDPDPANRALATVVARRGSNEPVTLEDIRTTLAARIPPPDLAPALDREALVHVGQLATTRTTDIAAAAVLLATSLAPHAARPIVEQAALDRRPKVREAAASVAGQVPGGSELLVALLRDKDPRVREAAFLSAVRSRPAGLKKIATGLAENDSDPRVREVATAFLRTGPQTSR